MNFFEHQATARRNTRRMLLLFALAVAGIVVSVDAAVWLALGLSLDAQARTALLLASSVLTLLVIGLGSLYRIATLRGGGESVAQQLGGVAVSADPDDPSLRRLRNVVEEIAIASGVPVPALYVLEHEAGINAFAAGYTPSDATVAVTRGALDRLNRDELQGVIAHEFSHILNGDMRLNIQLLGVLFGILMLSLIGRKVLQYGGGRGSKNAGVVLLLALAALLVGALGVFFGRLIKAGVSRQRELLADASAVQFTRQTMGLAGALKKIGGLGAGSRLNDHANAEEVSHMLFGEGARLSSWMATHPPLLERIRRLEPGFTAEALGALSAQWVMSPPVGLEEDLRLGLAPIATPAALPDVSARLALTPHAVAGQVATPGDDDYQRAGDISLALAPPLQKLARQRETAPALLLALLLDAAAPVAARQLEAIAAQLGDAMAAQAAQLRHSTLAGLHPALRLPLAALAFPALRQRPRGELDRFLDAVARVAHADGQLSLFEYCLGQLLRVQVREALDPSRHARFGRRRLVEVRASVATLLAVVAQAGHDGEVPAQRAFLAGMHQVFPHDAVPYAPPARGVLALDAVWKPLDALDPLAKQVLVESIVVAVSHDGQVRVAEAELLRTLCGVLHCPLPAMLERQHAATEPRRG